jgi:hypothetical protein
MGLQRIEDISRFDFYPKEFREISSADKTFVYFSNLKTLDEMFAELSMKLLLKQIINKND